MTIIHWIQIMTQINESNKSRVIKTLLKNIIKIFVKRRIMKRSNQSTVLITGALGGIGLATAKKYHKKGWSVHPL